MSTFGLILSLFSQAISPHKHSANTCLIPPDAYQLPTISKPLTATSLCG